MIEIQNLTKIFGTGPDATAALQNVDLTIHDGDIFGIIGMSGAGKSTLLRCLAMLETPTEGDILLDGQSLLGLTGKQKREAHRQMGVMFQGYNLLMQRTVAQNVAFPLKLEINYLKSFFMRRGHNIRPALRATALRSAELLDLVGLSNKANAYPSQLSGGQKQRVALARALATNPKVLLCDEPTSALDSYTTKSVLELLRRVNRELGVTIIIITHEIAVVKSICNRVAVINDSRFVEVGPTEETFKNPKTDITRLLLGQEVIGNG